MKHVGMSWKSAVLALLALALTGCQTMGESSALGGIIGAAAGAVIGHQSGSAGEGAVIGAVVGSAVGAISHDQRERRELERGYPVVVEGPVPRPRPIPGETSSETLLLENISVMPSTVRRGNLIEVSIQYAVLDADAGVRLKESRMLMKDGEEIELFSSRLIYRSNGSWVSPQQFRISERLTPGEYTIIQTVESRRAKISGVAKLTIR